MRRTIMEMPPESQISKHQTNKRLISIGREKAVDHLYRNNIKVIRPVSMGGDRFARFR